MASLPSHDVTLDKLDGYNYSLWSFKIEMLLQKEDLWEVVTENIPDEPKIEWKKKDSKARAIINLSIADSQIVHVKNLLTAKATWDTLKNIYERKTLSGKIYLLRKLYSLKLEEDKDMQQHITTMMELVDKLRTIGETLKDSHITAILLCSLPKSYSNLITMLESRPDDELTLEFTKNKLLDEHTRRVESSKDESTASKALKSLHGASSQRREKEKKFCSFCHKPNHSKEECWHYQKRNNSNKEYKYENFRRGNVPKYTNQSSVTQEQSTNQRTTKGPNPKALNCTQREASVHNWFVDSGATSHMAYDESFFTELNREQTQNVVVANGNKLQVKGIGQGEIKVITPQGKTDTLLLTKVLYIPELTDNLLSVSAATSNGCKVTFNRDWCTIERDNTALANGILDNGMYRLHLDDNPQTRTFKANVAKQNHCKNKNCLMLWHDRLGHRNIESIKKIRNENLARGLSLNNCSHSTDCVQCIQGKLTETPFPKKTEYRATETLQLVHSDICGPLPTNSLSGKRYFITFTDDYSRYTKTYLLKGKDEAYEKIKDYVISAHTEFGKNIQTIRTDNGREYVNRRVEDFLNQSGIKHQLTVPYSPAQNGVAERKNRSLMEMTRCMLFDSGLPQSLWAEAVTTANYLHNRIPSKATDKTPFELWTNRKPSLKHLKRFGCKAFAYIPKIKRNKLDSKVIEGIFLGYDDRSKGYRILHDTDNITISRSVKFIEKENGFHHASTKTTSPQVLSTDLTFSNHIGNEEESQEPGTQPENLEDSETEDYLQPGTSTGKQVVTQRRSTRPTKGIPPIRNDYMLYKTEAQDIPTPTSYSEVLQLPKIEREKWLQAMNEELNSLEKNNVWELTPLPKDKKIIGCKWTYKQKLNSKGEIERYKARLVAKGFNQKFGRDYEETFAPIVKHSTIRAFLAASVYKGMQVIHLDVKTAFLHGDLDKELYMELPEGLHTKQTNKVCKLKKAIYGLKQAGRSWNTKIASTLIKNNFKQSIVDPCLFTKNEENHSIYLILYVDDMLLANDSEIIIQNTVKTLEKEFEIKNLGDPTQFIGIEISRNREGELLLSQKNKIQELVERYNLQEAKPTFTPMENGYPGISDEKLLPNNVQYQQLIGSLLYLSVVSRPDIAAPVCILSSRNQNPRNCDWNAAKRIVRYLKTTKELELRISNQKPPTLEAYSDATWASDNTDRKSLSGNLFLLGSNPISWMTGKQGCVSLSSTEAELISAAEASKELLWLLDLLKDLELEQKAPIYFHQDNQSCLKICSSEKVSSRTKHIATKIHHLKDLQKKTVIKMVYCPTGDMKADILTKPLPRPTFEKLRYNLAAENWRFFKSQWDNYRVATELNKKDNNVIRAIFLSLIGKDCFNVFLNLDLKEDEKNSLPKIIEALNNHFTPQKNVIYERYIFNTSNQEEKEGIDSYTNRLRGLASSCEYDILSEELIRDRIVLGIKDNRVRKKLLMEPKLNLSSAIDICRTAEVTEQQITKLTGQESEDVKWNKKYERKKEETKATNETFEDIINCSYCGSKHRKASCPAYGKICTWCNRKNHFSKVYRFRSQKPKTLRSELLNRVHASHHGVAASLAKARQAIFWPGMNQSIKETVEKCKACLAYQPNQTKEPFMCHETPILPWNKIGMDIFSVETTQYLITVDYYSSFWELDILEHTTSESIIECYNGPQFISREFQKFLKTWKVVQITSSPYHSQSNGKAESAVKSAKMLVKKAKHEQEDLWLAILEWRNTPLKDLGFSPNQALISRRTQTLIPIHKNLLKPKARDLTKLNPGQSISVKLKEKDKWRMGKCISAQDPRSYIVEVENHEYRRNRRDIRTLPSGLNLEEEYTGQNPQGEDFEPNKNKVEIRSVNPPLQWKHPVPPTQAHGGQDLVDQSEHHQDTATMFWTLKMNTLVIDRLDEIWKYFSDKFDNNQKTISKQDLGFLKSTIKQVKDSVTELIKLDENINRFEEQLQGNFTDIKNDIAQLVKQNKIKESHSYAEIVKNRNDKILQKNRYTNDEKTLIIFANDDQNAAHVHQKVNETIKQFRQKGNTAKISKLINTRRGTILKSPNEQDLDQLIESFRKIDELNQTCKIYKPNQRDPTIVIKKWLPVKGKIKCIQQNIRKSIIATTELRSSIRDNPPDILLLQDPYVLNRKVVFDMDSHIVHCSSTENTYTATVIYGGCFLSNETIFERSRFARAGMLHTTLVPIDLESSGEFIFIRYHDFCNMGGERLTLQVEQTIRTLSKEGNSYSVIVKKLKAEGLDVGKATICRVVNGIGKKREAESNGQKFQVDRPRPVRTPATVSKVKRLATTENPPSQRQLSRMCGTSLKTINNIIHKDLELDTRRKGKVHKLTPFHMKNRAMNARKLYEEHLAGSRSEYTATLDEAWMYVTYCNGIRKICYIKRGNQVPDNWVHQCSETFPKGFMVVGVMTGRGVLPLIKVPSKVKVNSEFYIECVLKPVIEQLKDLYPGEMDKVFLHHDKASSHTSNKTQQFLQEMKDTLGLNFIRNSDIPVKSPDASPLDFYGFGMLKQRLFNRRPKTEAGLWKAAQEEWSNVSLSKVKEVFAAWKVRCREIAKKKGKHIEHMKKFTIIDLTISNRHSLKLVNNWQTFELTNISDHVTVSFDINVNLDITNNQQKSTWKFSEKKADWSLFSNTISKQEVRRLENDVKKVERETDIDMVVDRLSDIILEAAYQSLEVKSSNFTFDTGIKWWNKELEQKKKYFHYVRNRYFHHKAISVNEYKSVRNKYKNSIRKAKRNSWRDFIEENGSNNPFGNDYRTLKKLCSSNQQKGLPIIEQAPVDSKETLIKDLINELIPDDTTISDTAHHTSIRNYTPNFTNSNSCKIHKKEIEEIIDKINVNKAPGPDNISNNMIKNAFQLILPILHSIFNKCIQIGYFPKKWKTAALKIIAKPGKTNYESAKSYRPISLLSNFSKILEKILKNKIYEFYIQNNLLSSRQHGFIKSKSTITALNTIIDVLMEHKQKELSALITIDISGAFDNAWWPAIIKRIDSDNLPEKLIKILQSYLNYRFISFSYDNLTTSKPITKGCPQGGPLSPLLWTIF
ncbi:hypothetical protein LAZ67_17002102 [Cordylochernes scorpioides]|uniref:Retrovirus-related Pol polyprotein from transposon TNT 1-94 n=1 Tax=Cordylochernes scorpioides TaxID=51811 RepID=A0ABY6LFW2_9ARAC|nr:hypothetical protein LAZ67_17002102 [Cordylochernes scorpioides]